MSAPSDLTAAASELRVVLYRLVRRLRAEYRFPIMHGTVLGRLERDGALTASALADAERMRSQSMAQVIGELVEAGLVTRQPDPTDGRRILIEITPRGNELLREDREHRSSWLTAAIMQTLDTEEQVILIRAIPFLDRVAKAN